MSKVLTKYYCQKCKRELEPDQKICPHCGSNHRMIKVNIEEKIVIRETIKGRQKRKGFKKFLREWIQGWFPSKDKKRYPEGVEKVRIIDRENPDREDSYQEQIKDIKTGKIIRNVKEPLRHHRH